MSNAAAADWEPGFSPPGPLAARVGQEGQGTVLILRALLLAGVLLSVAGSTFAQLRTDALLDSCKRKTQVWESVQGKPQTVGEKIDGLCHGYLVGVYEASVEGKTICTPGEPPSPEYLLSVVETYLKAEPAARGKNATQVVRSAYLRAFPCKDKKGSAGGR